MKILVRDYPIFDGLRPHMHAEVKEHLDKSEFSADYERALSALLSCRKYRVLRDSIITHLMTNPKLTAQISKLANEAKLDPAWYALKGSVIGVARCNEDMSFVAICFRDQIVAAGGVFLTPDVEGEEVQIHYDLKAATDSYRDGIGEDEKNEQMRSIAITMGLAVPTFLEFAETETVIVNGSPHKTAKAKLDDEKYITDVEADVEIIDSGWYRTLIHEGDIGVRGHFRLQPYGEGRGMRRLIYINDFVRHGYKRVARVGKKDA